MATSCATFAATPSIPRPSNVMDELGLLDEFLKLPHQKVSRFGAQFGEEHVQVADFSHLPVRCPTSP